MSYVVLARKWRPTRFEDLVGQEHVARTLANAIASGRIAHAFLFTGVRGVGKTTSARLLARALNCLGPARPEGSPDPGPTSSPCLECAACREITAGNDVDVREIDGASYNGVDEVRKLQDSLPYRPTRDRYKIFIIDEVHMLSQSAWNAFLKTLEEPPPHVKFIFATTEVHKVPVTILSRVQRFDFKMIPARLIVDRLRTVLNAEGISSDEAGLSIIAREAAGSMRDAMSLLDQVIAWNDQGLDGDSVARVLGVASRKVFHELAASVIGGDAKEALSVIEQVSQQGFDLAHVAKDFLELLRDLVVAKVCDNSDDLIDLPDEERKDIARLAERSTADDLTRLYQGFSAGFDDVLRGSHPRSALEMLLVRLCRRPPLIPLDDLLVRLAGLEKRLGAMNNGNAPSGIPGGGAMSPMGGAPVQRRPATLPQGNVGPVANPPQRPRPRDEQTSAPRRDPGPDDNSDEPGPERPLPISVTPPVASTTSTVATNPSSTPARPSSPTASNPSSAPTRPSSPVTASSSSPPARPSDASRPFVATTNRHQKILEPPSESVPPKEPDPNDLMASWQDVVERVQKVRPEVSAVLEHAILIELSPTKMIVSWPPNSVFASHFDEQLLVELLRNALAERGDSIADILIAKDDPRAQGIDTLSSRETAERTRKYREDQARIRNHPRVKDAVEVLGARLVSVKLADQ
jgi:DNA polymerase-3 subunit gamma/tau